MFLEFGLSGLNTLYELNSDEFPSQCRFQYMDCNNILCAMHKLKLPSDCPFVISID